MSERDFRSVSSLLTAASLAPRGETFNLFHPVALVVLAQDGHGHVRVVLEYVDPLLGDRALEQLLAQERDLVREEIVAHRPGGLDVRRRRHEVGPEVRLLAAALDLDALVVADVAARRARP